MKKWIIALVLILAVVVVFVACKGNESEETTTQPTTESTTESTTTEIEAIPGDELILNDDAFTGDNVINIGGGSDNNSGEDSIDWSEIK